MEIVICFSLATFVIIHVRRNINMHDFPQQITLDVLHFDSPKNKTKKSAKNRTFLSKDDLESIKKRSLDFDSESEICFLVNEAQQQKFNKSLYKKMKAYLINKEMSKKTK